MSIQAVSWAIKQKTGSPTAKVLLICLANYADEDGLCWPSQATIANETELSERAAREWLKTLEENGFIERTRRHRADGTRASDLIRLCLNRCSETPPVNQPANSADSDDLPANGAEPTGTTFRAMNRQRTIKRI